MISARLALERLREGNSRFASARDGGEIQSSRSRRVALAKNREPFAIVLGCSDSRVPTEIIFDQDLGDLFVIRVAGNIAAASQIGSIEFAASRFKTRLVVVLGHSDCGAIQATLDVMRQPEKDMWCNPQSIVARIRPAIEKLPDRVILGNRDALIRQAIRANVRATVDQLCHGSRMLVEIIGKDELLVVGAEYSVETGVVRFLDQSEKGWTATENAAAD